MVDKGSAAPAHLHVRDLPTLLDDGDLLVVNDTKVIPARLRLHRETGGAAEVLLLEPLTTIGATWEAMIRPARKLRIGEQLVDSEGNALVEIGARTPAGDTWTVSIVGEGEPLDLLQRHGEMPLPPYIGTELTEPDRYQTVYAAEPASAAAPTAGLHFTPELLDVLAERGVEIAKVELVVGPRHVQAGRRRRSRSPRDAQRALQGGRRGDGAVPPSEACRRRRHDQRACARISGGDGELEGRTRLFITRPYEWKVVDLMMTNFHLPRTTLLMMIDAFVGDRWRRLYDVALAEGYRFLSFGDAMLLDRRRES